ncbi:MAG: hypothetical protein M5U01_27300 [Ardenticatenaceae bacterium]|nr:hypothetical protein [Ardenticatenaceae bacterium]
MVAGSGDPAGAGVSLSLGLDRQIQARPAGIERFWLWSPDLAIRREQASPSRSVGIARSRPTQPGSSGSGYGRRI